MDEKIVMVKRADELVEGDQIFERDGYLFRIDKVERKKGKIEITLNQGFSMVPVQPVSIKASSRVKCLI